MQPTASVQDLDPEDWPSFRAQAHAMLDDMIDNMESIREGPVWKPMSVADRLPFKTPIPRSGLPAAQVHRDFMAQVVPSGAGNLHPRFMGWVHGGGTAIGMLAEMLAGGLNANLGGRDQAPIEVERQVVRWMAELIGLPQSASGLFVTGASMANFIAVLVARSVALGVGSRQAGIGAAGAQLTAYTSSGAHNCLARAMDMAGLGSGALRLVRTDALGRIDLVAAAAMIKADRLEGRRPFLLIGTAGTVDIGAIDDLSALADLAEAEGLHFHVDGACGALGVMSPVLAPKFEGLERADSIALDFHKWGQAPYDAGFVIVRDAERHLAAFSSPADYLRRESRGLAAGSPWPCDFGPDLSRGFRALKVWFTLKVHGADRLGEVMLKTCAIAQRLAERIDREDELERLAPVELNIVCFRYRGGASDSLNSAIAIELQESGVAAPSTTVIDGCLAIRAAIFNHRTRPEDVDLLVDSVLSIGRRLTTSPVRT